MPAKKPTVTLDLDGCLIHYDGWKGDMNFGKRIKDADWFVKQLKEFAQPILFTTRTNPNIERDLNHAFIVRNLKRKMTELGFSIDVYTLPGKPLAACIVDDRAVRCCPALGDDYAKVLQAIKETIDRKV